MAVQHLKMPFLYFDNFPHADSVFSVKSYDSYFQSPLQSCDLRPGFRSKQCEYVAVRRGTDLASPGDRGRNPLLSRAALPGLSSSKKKKKKVFLLENSHGIGGHYYWLYSFRAWLSSPP